MGLRINTNQSGLTALRNLREAEKSQMKSLERLSTGLRINRASDDPSGLIISEQLRSQVKSLNQAVSNSENAGNLIGTAEAALNEINAILVGIRESVIFALNTGGSSPEQVQAEQDSVNNSLSAIARIASTTRFGSTHLLNGASGFVVSAVSAANFNRRVASINPISVNLDLTLSATRFTVDLQTLATRASHDLGAAATVLDTTAGTIDLEIRGNKGVEIIHMPQGSTVGDLEDAVNAVANNTGVFMDGNFALVSEGFGDDALMSFRQVGGSGALNPLMIQGAYYGSDVVATVNGISGSVSNGNTMTINSPSFTGTITFSTAEMNATVGNADFDILNRSGLLFQLGGENAVEDRRIIGIPNLNPDLLGGRYYITDDINSLATGGFLGSLRGGRENDLYHTAGLTDGNLVTVRPGSGAAVTGKVARGNALNIIDSAIDQVSKIRGFLGAFVAQEIEPNIRSLDVAIQNLTASESDIRDLNFAAETAEFTRSQVMFQAGVSVMASANLVPQTILQLLQ